MAVNAPREGASVQGILPAQSFRRADDFIFVSSIYPLDNAGNAVHAQSISQYIGEAEIAAQTRSVLETLKGAVSRLQGMFDPVTKVYNRFCLEELLQKEMTRCERHGKPLSLIMADLNKFKLINDTFGHTTGDFVLAEVGQILRSCVRGSDSVIRYGGDEFVLMLSETDQPGAAVVANRIQSKVLSWNENNKMAGLELGVSTGISVFTGSKKPAELIAEADHLMYAMKHSRASAALSQPIERQAR